MLENAALVHASMEALVEEGFFTDEAGATGVIDPEKVEAIGAFLFDAGILRDADGSPLSERPDFSAWFTNEFLAGG